MADTPQQAMILAAGLGTRMHPLTDDKPKALIQVAGKTLIDHAIDRLRQVGVTTIVVNLHYHADKLETHLMARRDVTIILSDERGQILDSGGGLAKALPHFSGKAFFTHNCDSLWLEQGTGNLAKMIDLWDDDAMDGLMLVVPTGQAVGYEGSGDFNMDRAGLLRRSSKAAGPADYVWTGVQIIHPRLFEGRPEGPFSTNVLWDKAIRTKRLFGAGLTGRWMHVGTPEAIVEAEALIADAETGTLT